MAATIQLSKDFPTPVPEESATSHARSPDNCLCMKETSPEDKVQHFW